MNGPSEEDPNYIADCGFSPAEMTDQVAAYRETINQFNQAVWANGGFTWMMMDWGGARLNTGKNNVTDPATCKAVLAASCTPNPQRWNKFQGYAIPGGGFGMTAQSFTDYTAEFLLTRGPYAILGYVSAFASRRRARARSSSHTANAPSLLPPLLPLPIPPPSLLQKTWFGCTNGGTTNPRATEWDQEFGEPTGVCAETSPGSGVYTRDWTEATVQWDCNGGHGSITRK